MTAQNLKIVWIKKATFYLDNLKFCAVKKNYNICNDIARKYERLLCSAINKRNKELQHFSKELTLYKNFLSKQLSIIDYYILTKSITSHNKKSPQKSLYTQQKSFLHWQGISTYQYSQLAKLFLISRNMNYPRKNLIYLTKIYTFSPTRRNSKIRNLHHL